jgi:hypothetical protein
VRSAGPRCEGATASHPSAAHPRHFLLIILHFVPFTGSLEPRRLRQPLPLQFPAPASERSLFAGRAPWPLPDDAPFFGQLPLGFIECGNRWGFGYRLRLDARRSFAGTGPCTGSACAVRLRGGRPHRDLLGRGTATPIDHLPRLGLPLRAGADEHSRSPHI